MSLKEFIEKKSEEIEKLEKKSNLAWWNLATKGDDAFAKEYQAAFTELRKLFSLSDECKYLRDNQTDSDPLIQRQAQLLLLQYRENQIPTHMIDKMVELETQVESAYTNFRPEVNGKALSNNDLKNILLTSTDSEQRKAVWEASKQIGEQVEDNVRELIWLRNSASKMAGFKGYYSMCLELQELNQDRLFEILGQLEALTNPLWEKYKPALDKALASNFGIAQDELMPWHYSDPFFQEAPAQNLDLNPYYKGKDLVAIGNKYYNDIGLPVDDILARSDLFEREKKNQHAFCINIDRKQDVRTLCNMRENEYWMGTLLHELGHGVYDKYIAESLPFILHAPAHTSSTEAIAMLFGRINKDGDFLENYCDVSSATAQKIGGEARRFTAANLLVFARWILVMTHFERETYQRMDLDHNKFWWDCVERFQGVKRPQGRDKPDWASKLHLACAPVYYQNYILGEMTASQLKHHLKDSHGKAVGEWLKDRLFSQGALRPWEQTLIHATGEGLDPHYFVKDASP